MSAISSEQWQAVLDEAALSGEWSMSDGEKLQSFLSNPDKSGMRFLKVLLDLEVDMAKLVANAAMETDQQINKNIRLQGKRDGVLAVMDEFLHLQNEGTELDV